MKSSAKIIHLIPQLRFGAGRCVVDMALEQALGLKHEVVVCASTDADDYWRSDPVLISELVSSGVEFEAIGDFFRRRADILHQCAAKVRGMRSRVGKETVVHAHTAMAAAVGHWAAPAAVIATCHGWGAGRPADFDLEDSLALQLCDSVLTYSTHWLERLRADLAVNDPRKIWMGVNLDRFPLLGEKRALDLGCPRIVTVCELTPRKGVDILLKAMPFIWERMPGTELHIMGNGDDAANLRRLAAEIDPGMKRISFYGNVTDPYKRLGEFDLFVLPSRSDNLPIAVLEAMLARLAIVASAVGGIPELISSAGCGIVVPPELPEALAGGICEAFIRGGERIASMGRQGEKFVRTHMDVRKTALDLDRIYGGAIRNTKQSRQMA